MDAAPKFHIGFSVIQCQGSLLGSMEIRDADERRARPRQQLRQPGDVGRDPPRFTRRSRHVQ